MKNFCEDFEDGYEPPEADEDFWAKFDESWDEVDQIVEGPLPEPTVKRPEDDEGTMTLVVELGSLIVVFIL